MQNRDAQHEPPYQAQQTLHARVRQLNQGTAVLPRSEELIKTATQYRSNSQ